MSVNLYINLTVTIICKSYHLGFDTTLGPVCYACALQIGTGTCSKIQQCGRDQVCMIFSVVCFFRNYADQSFHNTVLHEFTSIKQLDLRECYNFICKYCMIHTWNIISINTFYFLGVFNTSCQKNRCTWQSLRNKMFGEKCTFLQIYVIFHILFTHSTPVLTLFWLFTRGLFTEPQFLIKLC